MFNKRLNLSDIISPKILKNFKKTGFQFIHCLINTTSEGRLKEARTFVQLNRPEDLRLISHQLQQHLAVRAVDQCVLNLLCLLRSKRIPVKSNATKKSRLRVHFFLSFSKTFLNTLSFQINRSVILSSGRRETSLSPELNALLRASIQLIIREVLSLLKNITLGFLDALFSGDLNSLVHNLLVCDNSTHSFLGPTSLKLGREVLIRHTHKGSADLTIIRILISKSFPKNLSGLSFRRLLKSSILLLGRRQLTLGGFLTSTRCSKGKASISQRRRGLKIALTRLRSFGFNLRLGGLRSLSVNLRSRSIHLLLLGLGKATVKINRFLFKLSQLLKDILHHIRIRIIFKKKLVHLFLSSYSLKLIHLLSLLDHINLAELSLAGLNQTIGINLFSKINIKRTQDPVRRGILRE